MNELEQFKEYFDLKFSEYQNKIDEGFNQIDKNLDDLLEQLTQTIKN